MPWEFPAVSQSRIEFWGEPQYTRKGMLIFTILFGFLGLHHFYLRSPQTGLLFLIFNILTLGYWWFYDILQLATTEHKDLNAYGLSTPWGAAGIAQGMFMCTTEEEKQQEALDKEGAATKALKRFSRTFLRCSPPIRTATSTTTGTMVGGADENAEGPPDPIWFLLYSLLLPLAPLSRLIAGDSQNALIAFLCLTIVPFGFIILGFQIASEYFTLFTKPADLLVGGIKRSFPFTLFGWDPDGQSSRLTGITEDQGKEQCEEGFLSRVAKGSLPILRTILPAPLAMAIDTAVGTAEKAVELKTQVVDRAIEVGQQSLETAGKVANLTKQASTGVLGSLDKAAAMVANPEALERKIKGRIPTAPTLPGTMQGGASEMCSTKTSWSSSDVVAGLGLGALVLSGFVFHTGRSLWDAVQRTIGPDDQPPEVTRNA